MVRGLEEQRAEIALGNSNHCHPWRLPSPRRGTSLDRFERIEAILADIEQAPAPVR